MKYCWILHKLDLSVFKRDLLPSILGFYATLLETNGEDSKSQEFIRKAMASASDLNIRLNWFGYDSDNHNYLSSAVTNTPGKQTFYFLVDENKLPKIIISRAQVFQRKAYRRS